MIKILKCMIACTALFTHLSFVCYKSLTKRLFLTFSNFPCWILFHFTEIHPLCSKSSHTWAPDHSPAAGGGKSTPLPASSSSTFAAVAFLQQFSVWLTRTTGHVARPMTNRTARRVGAGFGKNNVKFRCFVWFATETCTYFLWVTFG